MNEWPIYIPAVTVDVFVVNEADFDYTLVCNAETRVPANLTDFHWISPQGELVYPRAESDTNARVDVIITNFTFIAYEYATILNSSLSFRPLSVEDAGVWTCNVTFNLTFPDPGVNLSNQTSQDIFVRG